MKNGDDINAKPPRGTADTSRSYVGAGAERLTTTASLRRGTFGPTAHRTR